MEHRELGAEAEGGGDGNLATQKLVLGKEGCVCMYVLNELIADNISVIYKAGSVPGIKYDYGIKIDATNQPN